MLAYTRGKAEEDEQLPELNVIHKKPFPIFIFFKYIYILLLLLAL